MGSHIIKKIYNNIATFKGILKIISLSACLIFLTINKAKFPNKSIPMCNVSSGEDKISLISVPIS